MDGIILAALALLSVPVLFIVILVKVCGLENKVTDLALKLTVIDFTQKRGKLNEEKISLHIHILACILYNMDASYQFC